MVSIAGIIPAAGKAERLYGLPKMLLPVQGGHLLGILSERLLLAGASPLLIGTSEANELLIRRYALCSAQVYRVQSRTMSETVLSARRFVGNAYAVMGMPDTYWDDETIIPRLVASLRPGGPIVTAALWQVRPEQRGTLGQCQVDGNRIIGVVDKNPACSWQWAWGALAWSPSFWDFMAPDYPHLGYALARAVLAGVQVHAVFAEGEYHDCGTLDGYARLCASMLLEAV